MLSFETINRFRKQLATQPDAEQRRIVTNAVSNASWKELYDTKLLEGAKYTFGNVIKPEPEVTNQQDSGRCWIFAGLNLLRRYMMIEYGFENFEFSQSYIAFYDKLERANYFAYWLKNTFEKHPDFDFSVYNLEYQYWFNTLFDDGGQFVVFADLVKKYGLMPKEEFGDTYYSANTAEFITMLKATSTMFMMECTKNKLETYDKCREKYLSEIYRLLTQFYGFHRESFLFKYPSNKHVKHKISRKRKENEKGVENVETVARVHGGKKRKTIKKHMKPKMVKEYESIYVTPKEFYEKYVPIKLENYVSIVNDPRHQFNKMYKIDNLKTLVGGPEIEHFNINIDELKKITKSTLDKGSPVWFTCDVGNFIHFEKEIADTNLFDEKRDLGIRSIKDVSKEDRLKYGISKLDHAMLLCGYQDRPDKSMIRWKVENSWSASGDGNGYLTISDDWFKQFVYQIIVDLDDLPKEIRDKIQKVKPKDVEVLPNYDPLGNGAFID
jgi:bleomycin hydrolase